MPFQPREDTVLISIPMPITFASTVTGIIRELLDAMHQHADIAHLTDSIAFGLYGLADDLRRRAHPEWPDLRPMLHELSHAVPDDIHPQAQCFINEWLSEADYVVMPAEVMRLATMVTDKIADELRWNAERTASCLGPDHPEVADCLKRAKAFDGWLDRHATKDGTDVQ